MKGKIGREEEERAPGSDSGLRDEGLKRMEEAKCSWDMESEASHDKPFQYAIRGTVSM